MVALKQQRSIIQQALLTQTCTMQVIVLKIKLEEGQTKLRLQTGHRHNQERDVQPQ